MIANIAATAPIAPCGERTRALLAVALAVEEDEVADLTVVDDLTVEDALEFTSVLPEVSELPTPTTEGEAVATTSGEVFVPLDNAADVSVVAAEVIIAVAVSIAVVATSPAACVETAASVLAAVATALYPGIKSGVTVAVPV
jgi:hypothetical protein